MTEPVHDYQTIETATIEGLEDFFDSTMGQALDQAQPEKDEALGLAHVKVAEAASMLGIDRRYALRLAHKGKLRGYQDSNGQWFISRDSIEERMGQAQGKPHVKVVLAQVEAHPAQDQDQAEAQGLAQPIENELIRELQAKVEALTWRNGYLESQLETQREHIKLLTDSQHKPGWWARFTKWCAGQ